jgi:hypothetical protein
MFPKNHSIVGLVRYQSILEKYENYRTPPKMPFQRMIFGLNLVGLYGQLEHSTSNITPNSC